MKVLETEIPTTVGMHKGLLKPLGGDLKNLYQVRRLDTDRRSRSAATACHKDYSTSYRPWRKTGAITEL